MNNKTFLILFIVLIIASLGGYFWFQSNLNKKNQAEAVEVKSAVEGFGNVLKNVPLLASKEIVDQSIRDSYGAFVSPDLLSLWIDDPSKAPGRLTSSPWPERIEVTSVNKINSYYQVIGNVVEITSQEVVAGGNAGLYPITIKVEKINNEWLITNFEGYPKTQSSDSIEYQNTQYGFSFLLPKTWEGYTIVLDKWQGYTFSDSQGDVVTEQGPLISVRHPQWTSQNPRQDIPIMVFTLSQWDSLLQDKFHIGAAPINPSRLGSNANYVFALPARYNFAFLPGYEEVDSILQNNPLQALPSPVK